MTADILFYIILSIITINFIKDKILDSLNAKHYNDPIPQELSDVYDEDDYAKSQAYKTTNYGFNLWTSLFSFVITLAFLLLDGFEFIDNLARSVSDNPVIVGLLFFGIIMIASDIITTPFSYYKTFVIEEKFGFNKTTKKTFLLINLKDY